MKVMQVMGGDEEGGLEKHVVELTNGLSAAGDDMLIVAHPKYEDRVASSVIFVPLDLTRSRRNPVMLWQLLQLIKHHKPDVLHAQGGKAMAILRQLKPWLPQPMVASVHGQKRRQNNLHAFAKVITVSQGLADRISHPAVEVVYNGVAPQQKATPQETAALRMEFYPPAGLLWLAVGRLVPIKGFDVLINAFRRVDAGHLLIAGDGPELTALSRQIEELGMEERITLLGHRDDVSNLMAICDCTVISSRSEGFSYVFAEALIQGCPVISTDVPIPNEVLAPALICPINDPDGLSHLMNALDTTSVYHEQARAFARQHLSIEAMVSDTRRVYSQTHISGAAESVKTQTDSPRT